MPPCAPTIMSASADAADDSAEMPSFSFPPGTSTTDDMELIAPMSPLVRQGVQQISEESSDTEVSSIASSSSGRATPMIPANHSGGIATLAASAESPPPESSSCRARQEDKTTGKRLRFNSNVVLIDDLGESKTGDTNGALDDTSSPSSSTWWSPDDLRTFKESARSTCRKVRKRRAFTTCIDVAYQTVSKSSGESNANNDNEDDDDSHQGEATKEDLMKLIHRGLTKWSTHGHSCRGLERRASVYQFTTRQEDIIQARRAVFNEQARQYGRKRARTDSYVPLAAESVTADCTSPLSSSVIEDVRTGNSSDSDQGAASAATSIQQASLVKTERACLFARMMGKADAAAAKEAVLGPRYALV